MDLQQLIEEGLSLLRGDAQHDLKVAFRCRLLATFDEGDKTGSRLSSRKKRVQLATLAIENVLQSWEAAFPNDRTPHRALELGQEVLLETVTSAAAAKEYGWLWTHCDNLMFRHDKWQNQILVGYGALQVVSEALSPTRFGCDGIKDATTDIDIDPSDHDSSFYAAAVYSGGATWEHTSDSLKRLEFWTWWLTSAVPAAFDAS